MLSTNKYVKGLLFVYKIILVGNPNTGKTTLFNSLTKSDEKASNWHGVTVGIKSKKYMYRGDEFFVSDTPGVYSLDGSVAEEKITADYLEKHKEDLIVNICDANNIKRNLMLTKELLNLGYKVLLAVNMSQEVCLCDYEQLSGSLNCDIVEIDARKKKSVDKLKDKIYCVLSNKKPQKIIKINKKPHSNNNFNVNFNNINPYKRSDSIDKTILNKYIFIPFFLLCLFAVFFIVFGAVGSCFSNIINMLFNKIMDKMRKIILCTNINNMIKILLIDGILGSFASVASFFPQVLLLMFFINFLEDIGLMSRVAFMLDGIMKKIGLSGKSLFSLFMGYGCTTSAVVSTRNIENIKCRKRTVMLLPFSTCSAKLPIFLTISSLFFKKHQYLFILGLYIFAIVVQIVYASLLNKFSKVKEEYLLIEMPKYRVPNLKKILTDTFRVFKEFILKTGGLIFVFGVLIWVLQNFDLSFNFLNGQDFTNSILYNLAEFVTPIFKPLGLGNPAIVIALIFGLIAKEMLLLALAMMNGVLGDISLLSLSLMNPTSVCYFTKISSIVFLVFVLLYSPCVSCVSSMRNEIGVKSAGLIFISQFILAYIVSLIIKILLNNIDFLFWIIVIIVLANILLLMLKFNYKGRCKGNCDACRRI